MARGDHRSCAIRPEDTIILASSLIPGNETAVFGVINGLTRLGATVVHQGNAKVHVSGHAPAGELLFLYNAVRPSNVMPVHGEWRHLRANAALAGAHRGAGGVAWCSPRTASSSTWSTARAAITGRVEVGRVYVDGLAVGDIGETTLGDRLALGEGGFISITVAVDATHRARGRPARRCPGAGSPTTPRRSTRVLPLVEDELSAAGERGHHRHAPHRAGACGAWSGAGWAETYRRRPMIVPTVIAV